MLWLVDLITINPFILARGGQNANILSTLQKVSKARLLTLLLMAVYIKYYQCISIKIAKGSKLPIYSEMPNFVSLGFSFL